MSDHRGHDHAHAHRGAASRPALSVSPLAFDAGARLIRVGAALAVLWIAVAWALAS